MVCKRQAFKNVVLFIGKERSQLVIGMPWNGPGNVVVVTLSPVEWGKI